MEIIKEINLNINQPNNFELINVMQGSLESVRVIAHLYDGNKPYQIPDTVSEYQLLGILPSGKYLIDDQLSKYNDNSVTFLIPPNMMAKTGYVQFSISLVEKDDKAIVETFPAKIMVTAIPGQEYEQTDEIPIITKSLQEVKKNAEIAVQAAERSEEYYHNFSELTIKGVSGIKGNAETEYRTGNVNITPENIGTYSKSVIDAMQKTINLLVEKVGGLDDELPTGYYYLTDYDGSNLATNSGDKIIVTE